MKFGPVPKLDKRNKIASKHLAMMSCWKTVTSLPFFRFIANLVQSKTENRTKKYLTQLSLHCFE